MPIFRHTADDIIIFDSGSMPLSFFVTLEAAYTLPVGKISRDYIQGSYHILSDGSSAEEGEFPYTDGDTYISNEAIYIAAYAAYLIPAPTLPDTLAEKLDDLNTYYEDTAKSGNATTADGTFESQRTTLEKLNHEFLTYTSIGALPTGYFVVDTSNVRVVMAALANLENIINTIVDLHYYCGIVYDIHSRIINALGSISDINAYDYEIGWPIVPYTYGITFLACYYDTINATSALGTLTGTATGGAAIANYKLDLAHDDARYVDYNANNNADSQQVGTIKFVLEPNYSGAPSANRVFFSICEADNDITNLIQLTHVTGTGQLKIDVYDNADVLITGANFDVWSPTAATQYEFILQYDLTSGANKLFIDGVQVGITNTATGTRSAAIGLLRVGGSYNSGAPDNSNFSIRFFTVYNN